MFIKLKKSGSATVKQALFSKVCGTGDMRWRASCGEYQGESTPEIYARGGLDALSNCLTPRHAVRAYALVRDPLARLISAIYFFGKGLRDIPAPRVSAANVSAAIRCGWTGCRAFGNLQPSTLAVFSQMWTAPPAQERLTALARAEANLRRDDVVIGTLERLDEFLRIVVLEIGGVAPEAVCTGHVHERWAAWKFVDERREAAEIAPHPQVRGPDAHGARRVAGAGAHLREQQPCGRLGPLSPRNPTPGGAGTEVGRRGRGHAPLPDGPREERMRERAPRATPAAQGRALTQRTAT